MANRKRKYYPESQAKRRIRHKNKAVSEGTCPDCGAEHDTEFVNCPKCRDRKNAAIRIRNAKWKELGLCGECGKETINPSIRCCWKCWFRKGAARWCGGTEFSNSLRELWDSQGGTCAYTGKPLIPGLNAEIDHKVSRKNNGKNELANLQFVDEWVNTIKGTRNHDEFLLAIPSLIADLQKILDYTGAKGID